VIPILPELVGRARSVKVFQRAPAWVVPERRRGLLPVRCMATAHLRRQVKDPWLRRQLTPDEHMRHPVPSDTYYPALQRANCTLITWPIATLAPRGIRAADGIEYQVDCIIVANP
jgi:cation diffusion facilitator CzcD-associated flavoprotein CzcO